MDIPSELLPLLSCTLCGRLYSEEGRHVPKLLSCQHCYCRDCLDKELLWSLPCNGREWICGRCGMSTKVEPDMLPEPEYIMYLIRNLRALQLGQVMMAMQAGPTSPQAVEAGAAKPIPEPATMAGWMDDVCVNRFLTNSCEHCLIHGLPNTTWCHNCRHLMCRGCANGAAHSEHQLTCHMDFSELVHQLLSNEMDKIKRACSEVDALARRDMAMLRVLFEGCHQLQNTVRKEILGHKPSMVVLHMRDWLMRSETMLSRLWGEGALGVYEMHQLLGRASAKVKLFRKQVLHLQFQYNMRAIIQENGMHLLTFELLNERILGLQRNPNPNPPQGIPGDGVPPALVMINYCIYNYWQQMQQQVLLVPRQEHPPHHSQPRHEHSLMLPINNLWQIAPLEPAPSTSGSSHSFLTHNYPHPAAQLFNNDYNRLNLGLLLGQNNAQAQQHHQHQQGSGMRQHGHGHGTAIGLVSIGRLPSVHCYPIYYMDMEIAGRLAGRVLIEVNKDAAPRMAENFGSLIRQDRGFGYRGCVVFQTWGNESIITGDFESQNGRGGHAAFEERFFQPDNSRLKSHRGAVGMRRSQKRHDHHGLVGSQFRVLLNEHQIFTAIFGYIIDGIEMIDRIAATGNPIGRPGVRSIIKDCGLYCPVGTENRSDQPLPP
ncbi:GL22150 [Drosophila persimilis]|uniref:GL22150 n=1 Tax=Drosophila persimilis TaxID=7234 RepID=B4GF66_DROPE|nr:GL22150 [Drosophila persimilis]